MKWLISAALILLLFGFAGAEGLEILGTVEGTGTYFEVTNSAYLNVTLTSSEEAYVYLESAPRMVSFHIESTGTASSAVITLTGFEPNKTYYLYQDGDLLEEFTDAGGVHSFTQDLTEPHHVFIQEQASTIYIRADGSIDPVTAPISRNGNTYTLTDDIYESIHIQKSGITLNGAGYTVQGTGAPYPSGYGIYARRVSNLTIKNINIENFYAGIFLVRYYAAYSSSNNTVINNTISDSSLGIYLYKSTNNTITYNNILRNRYGMKAFRVENNTISHNTVTNQVNTGIYLDYQSNYNTVKNNTISNTSYYGMITYSASNNIIKDNLISNNGDGIRLYYGSGNIIAGNTFSGNPAQGIMLYTSHYNRFYHNNVKNLRFDSVF